MKSPGAMTWSRVSLRVSCCLLHFELGRATPKSREERQLSQLYTSLRDSDPNVFDDPAWRGMGLPFCHGVRVLLSSSHKLFFAGYSLT